MTVKFTNNANSTLASGINSSVTSMTLADASSFPSLSGANDYCYLTLQESGGTTREIVKATARSSNTFTIVRGQDNTSAATWSSGVLVELRITSALLQDVIDGLGSGSMMDTDIFTGDGSDTTFTLSRQPDNENNLLIFIDGVFQAHNAYSVSGTTLTLSAAPANGRVITAYHMATTVGGSNLIKATMTGDNSDTTLDVGSQIIHENNVQVYFDGVYQSKGNYSVSGSVITFSTAPPTGVAVEAILNTATNISTAAQVSDADNDTLIQVEESADEDTIRMDVAGTEVLTLTNSAMTLKGTTPTLTIGDAGAEDTKIVFDGNAQDFYIGLDDSADDLVIGKGSTVGTTPAISIDENINSTFAGIVTADAGIDIDNINIDGTTIALSSGDLTLDVAGDIILDADGGDVNFKDGGTLYGFMAKSNDDLYFGNAISDGDVLIRGSDGGSNITALSFDMSAAGAAAFNSYITSTAVYGKDDGNTGIQFDGSDVITLHTGGAERVRIDASGNLNISTDVGTSQVNIYTGNVTGAGTLASSAINIAHTTHTNGMSQITFGYQPGSLTYAAAYIGYIGVSQAGYGNGDIVMGTRDVTTDSQPTEHLRIPASGITKFAPKASHSNIVDFTTHVGDQSSTYVRFQPSGTNRGYIGNGSALLSGAGDADFIIRSEDALVFNSGGNNRRMTIESDGGVAIGDTTCVYTFEVHGTSIFRGSTYTNGFCAPLVDNTYDLGHSSYRWDDIYATNSTIQTSDKNLKNNITESDLGLSFIKELKPVSYKWKEGKSDRTHYGLIAQDVETVLSDISKPTSDFAGFIKMEPEEEAPKHEENPVTETRYGLRYNEFIAPLIKAVQEQQALIETLQAEVKALKEA